MELQVYLMWLFNSILVNFLTEAKEIIELDDSPEAIRDNKIMQALDLISGDDFRFRIDIQRGAEECFHQKMEIGETLYISYQVLRGGDRRIDLYIRSPQQSVPIVRDLRQRKGTRKLEIEHAGVYTVCFDNTNARFSKRFLEAHVASWKKENWEGYQDDLEQFQISAEGFSVSLANLQSQIRTMRGDWNGFRFALSVDEIMIRSSGYMVDKVSMAMCALIVLTSAFQVFFVRRLFHVPKSDLTLKTRI